MHAIAAPRGVVHWLTAPILVSSLIASVACAGWLGPARTPSPRTPGPPVVAPADPSSYADPAATDRPVTIIGRLVSSGRAIAGCGVFEMFTPMEWAIESVEDGVLPGHRVRAIVGCAELPRNSYRDGAGTLDRFRTGERHRLVIRSVPTPGHATRLRRTFIVVSADPA